MARNPYRDCEMADHSPNSQPAVGEVLPLDDGWSRYAPDGDYSEAQPDDEYGGWIAVCSACKSEYYEERRVEDDEDTEPTMLDADEQRDGMHYRAFPPQLACEWSGSHLLRGIHAVVEKQVPEASRNIYSRYHRDARGRVTSHIIATDNPDRDGWIRMCEGCAESDRTIRRWASREVTVEPTTPTYEIDPRWADVRIIVQE